jgi:hypothetical protein
MTDQAGLLGIFVAALGGCDWRRPRFDGCRRVDDSMAKSASAGVPPRVAAEAIAIGVLVNCVMKAGLALGLGTAPLRRLAGATLTAMAVVGAVTLAIGVMR